MATPDRETFENMYAAEAPWDIGKPQNGFIDSAAQITGRVLDAGCGTGDTSVYFATRGCDVTGIDFLAEPIARAKQKAAQRGLKITFLVKDAMTLAAWGERFDNVVDSGLFHVFGDDDRRKYVTGLASVLKPGGRLFLNCFSDLEHGDQGPRRISKRELQDAFAAGWTIESIRLVQLELNPNSKGMSFSPGGPKAWFAVIRRLG
jgi:cyclopropane fatty-acyl-phospholipid synthase-like methyltransferase